MYYWRLIILFLTQAARVEYNSTMPSKTVLIIEDSVELADTLHDMLELHGLQALKATRGRDGLDLAFKEHPDLILLDIRLPDMSGYDVYHELRQDDWGKNAKLLVLTASESLENIAKNINLPVKYVLFKPDTSIKLLIERIEERLAESSTVAVETLLQT